MSHRLKFGSGFVVDRDELVALLNYISHDLHRWEVVADDDEDDMQSVVVLYSNPDGTNLPNQISFRFPCLSDGTPFFPSVLSCLHPSLAEPVSPGLYFEGADIKYDPLEDWSRFWSPIVAALIAPGSRQSTASRAVR